MKITDTRHENTKEVGELNPGDVFMYNYVHYMKTSHGGDYKYVRLHDGFCVAFLGATKVLVLDTELLIK